MPHLLKALILSHQGTISEDEKSRLIASLPSGIEHQIAMAANLESAESLIKDGNYDIVVCAPDLMISPWELLKRCEPVHPNEKKPIFVIDGQVEDILQREFALSPFSGAAAIVKENPESHAIEFKFEGAYNAANEDTPNGLSTHFNIGSSTKMMTSVAFAKLMEEEGSVFSLDTPIYESLIQAEKLGKVIDPFYLKVFSTIPDTTPRQLLSHTSGLRDHLGKIFESDLGPEVIGFTSVRDYTEHFHSFDNPLYLEEDRSHEYCNFGYQLLGLAIEAVKGDYYQYLQESVLDVAGMTHTTPLRRPGADFAVPFIDSSPVSSPELPTIQNQQNEEIAELEQAAREILTEAQQFSEEIKSLKPLIDEYQQALSTCPPDKFDEFKKEFGRKIGPVFTPILNLIKKIEATGLPLHWNIEKIKKDNSKDERLTDLQQLDRFFEQLHGSLMPSAINSILNSLSKASPDGRNMYSTVDDMLRFQQAISSGALSEYRKHLTTATVSFPRNPSGRYGLGCGVIGNESDLDHTLAHGGDAPGMHAAFQTYPNKGYTIVTLANNDVSQRYLAEMAEKNLVFGERESVFYLDPRINPNVSQSIQKSLADRKPQEMDTSEHDQDNVGIQTSSFTEKPRERASVPVNMKSSPEALAVARDRCESFKARVPHEAPTEPGKIILLCGTSTAGKTSICTAVRTEARKTGHDWIVDGRDIAEDKAWTEPCEIDGKRYPSAQDHLGNAMKTYTDPSVVDAAISKFGARTLAAALLSRRNVGHPKIDQVDLTPEADIKKQATKIYDALSPENKEQYTPIDIENLLIIIRDCPEVDEFLTQHPYPPLEDVNKQMLERAITRAKKGESTIFDIIGNEVIDGQRMVDQFHDRLKAAGLPAETGTVAIIHCPVVTLIDRMDGRNKKAIAEDRIDDVRQDFFPFDQYGVLYEKAPAIPDPTRPIVGVVTRHDITNAAHRFGGGEDDATSLLAKLGFTDGEESISVVSRIQGDAIFQTGLQSSQHVAECLCERAFGNTPVPNDTEKRFGY